MARRLSLRPSVLLVLVAAVLALHACVGGHIAQTVAAWSAEAGFPERLQVAYVRQMVPSPPEAPLRPSPPATARVPEEAARPPPSAAAEAAQVAAEAASAPAQASDTVAALVTPPTAVPDAIDAIAAAAADIPPVEGATPPVAVAAVSDASRHPVEAAPDAPPFVWPASTRLSYRLSGQYRGEVHGQAQVEWVLAAPRYQVHLDVSVGLPVAPLFTRRMSSDGRLTASGLRPERYDEVSKMAFRDRRHVRVLLDDAGVLLADGQRWLPPSIGAGSVTPVVPDSAVQDSASQFVQLSYLFTLRPELLVPGREISFPLALPRRVEPWVYEVVGAQTQATPFGPIETFHVRPRRGTPRGNDLLAEAWFAPQLAYLPVRIRIEQDAEVFIDLVLDRPPELAAR